MRPFPNDVLSIRQVRLAEEVRALMNPGEVEGAHGRERRQDYPALLIGRPERRQRAIDGVHGDKGRADHAVQGIGVAGVRSVVVMDQCEVRDALIVRGPYSGPKVRAVAAVHEVRRHPVPLLVLVHVLCEAADVELEPSG